MNRVRRNLRLLVASWLLSLSASLCAFAPPGCCTAHEAASEECRGDSGGVCPMHAASGDDCPLHAASSQAGSPGVMRGLCNGPAASLAALIPVPGVLVQAPHLAVAQHSVPVVFAASEALELIVAHDSPPPRL